MKIGQILKAKKTVSFEFFPPKTEEGEISLFETINNLKSLNPDFISITYGAGGSTRDKTVNIAKRISKEYGLNVMAHLTAINHTKVDIIKLLDEYKNEKIDNILALRGDTPQGTDIDPDKGEIPHTSDLIKIIKDNFSDYFSIGGAAFPEMHPESPNMEWEMRYFKLKKDLGLEFAITQLFFDNAFYLRFRDLAIKKGIDIPIVAGLMPITNWTQIKKFTKMCLATIPERLVQKIEKYIDNQEEIEKIGIEYSISQCEELLKNDVPGIHFYTLNKSKATIKIYNAIKELF